MKKRDYGVDLLRLFSMGLIILHHLLVHGGVLFALSPASLTGSALHLLNACTRSAVNAYALISGYVMVNSSFRPSRMLSLWLQVAFYGVLAVVCLPLMSPDTAAAADDWRNALLPITHDHYWYFTCYAPVLLLSPALNLLLRSISKRQTTLMITVLIGLFSILPTIGLNDPFQLANGYHFGWLMILYVLGACLRLHGFGKLGRKWLAALAFAACTVLGWASVIGLLPFGESLLYYTAPTMLLCGVALLSLFRQIRLPCRLQKIIAVLSPLTFGVYLIHDNPLVRTHLMQASTAPLAERSFAGMLAGLTAYWLIIYLACLAIEWLRSKLFALLHIPKLCSRIDRLSVS